MIKKNFFSDVQTSHTQVIYNCFCLSSYSCQTFGTCRKLLDFCVPWCILLILCTTRITYRHVFR